MSRWRHALAISGLLGVALAARGAVGHAQDPREALGWRGKVEVRMVEAAYRLDGNSLKVRVHLVSGLAVDYDAGDAADVDRILAMTRIFVEGQGKARMFAEMEAGQLRALHVSVP